MTDADRATAGSAIKLGAEVAGRLLGFATTVVIARGLGVGTFGRFEVAAAAAVIAAEIADLGLSATAGRELVAGRISVSSVLRAKLRLLPVVLAFGLAVGWWAGLSGGALPGFVPLLLFFAATGWIELMGTVLRARARPLQEALTILVFRAAVLVVVAATVARGPDLSRLAWSQLLATVGPLLLAVALARRGAAPATEASLSPAALLRSARPLGVNAILTLLSLRVELLALGLWAAADEVGLFAVGQKLVSFLLVVPAAIAAGAMPALVREHAAGGQAVRARTATTLALVAVPAAVGLAVAPGAVAVLGDSYTASAGVLRLLAPAVVAMFLSTLVHHQLIAAGRGGRVVRLTAVRVAVAVVLAALLVPRAGVFGAAVGFSLAELGMLVLGLRACAREGFPVPARRALAAGLLVALPVGLVMWVVEGSDLRRVMVGAAIGGASLLAALLARRVRGTPLG